MQLRLAGKAPRVFRIIEKLAHPGKKVLGSMNRATYEAASVAGAQWPGGSWCLPDAVRVPLGCGWRASSDLADYLSIPYEISFVGAFCVVRMEKVSLDYPGHGATRFDQLVDALGRALVAQGAKLYEEVL